MIAAILSTLLNENILHKGGTATVKPGSETGLRTAVRATIEPDGGLWSPADVPRPPPGGSASTGSLVSLVFQKNLGQLDLIVPHLRVAGFGFPLTPSQAFMKSSPAPDGKAVNFNLEQQCRRLYASLPRRKGWRKEVGTLTEVWGSC